MMSTARMREKKARTQKHAISNSELYNYHCVEVHNNENIYIYTFYDQHFPPIIVITNYTTVIQPYTHVIQGIVYVDHFCCYVPVSSLDSLASSLASSSVRSSPIRSSNLSPPSKNSCTPCTVLPRRWSVTRSCETSVGMCSCNNFPQAIICSQTTLV